MGENSRLFYEFGSFRVDETERRLTREGAEVVLSENGKDERLSPKTFDLLLTLLEHQGRMVRREELIELLWPGTFVEDNRLSDNISTLRKFLGDTSKKSKFIETVPKYGYRFVAEVREIRDEAVAFIQQRKTQILIEQEEDPGALLPPNARALPGASPKSRSRFAVILISLVLVLGAAVAIAIYLIRTARTNPAPTIKSIAVLPFKPLITSSADPALEIGMTDALITKLSNLREVVVRPTSAVLKYNDPGQDPLAAGREQGVDALLDGRVQKTGDRIRVTVQLVRVSDGVSLWGREFNESFTNIFSVQDSISEQAVQALTLRLTRDQQQRLTNRYTENIEAYQLYLQGRHFMDKRTVEDLRRSLNYYQQAIDIDSNYALAYSGLAYAYHLLAFYKALTPDEAYPPARRAALRALEIDPGLAEAYASLARIKEDYDSDPARAGEYYRHAIEISPNYATAHRLYSRYLLKSGRIDEAIIEARRAQELDPLSLIANAILGENYYYARQWDQTLKYMLRVREIDPGFQTRYIGNYLYLSYMRKGMYREAILENAKRLSDHAGAKKQAAAVAALNEAFRSSGVTGIWRKQIELAGKQQKEDPDMTFFMAEAHTHLGEADQAFVWLNRAADEKHPAIDAINYDPDYDSIRSDPRFAQLLRRLKPAPSG